MVDLSAPISPISTSGLARHDTKDSESVEVTCMGFRCIYRKGAYLKKGIIATQATNTAGVAFTGVFMKERRFPLIPVIVVGAILITLIAAMVVDVPASQTTTEVDVTLPAAASN